MEPEVLKHLKHFDVYGLANNHAIQHGSEAYEQTFDAIRSYGSECFGTNMQRSVVIEHQGQKVSFTGMCLRIDEFTDSPLYWYNPEYKEIETELKLLPQQAFKVLYIHWGNEFINRLSVVQKKFAHWLIDAGFDLIIGMHPHVLQGYEEYKGKYIFYSLGNFVFEMAWKPTSIGAIVKFDLQIKKPKVEYVHIEKDCAPAVVEEKEIPLEWRFVYLNDVLKKDDNSEQYHAEINRNYTLYRKANYRYIIRNMVKHPKLGVSLIKDFVKRRIIK